MDWVVTVVATLAASAIAVLAWRRTRSAMLAVVIALIGPTIGMANAVGWGRGTLIPVLLIVFMSRRMWLIKANAPTIVVPPTYHGPDEALQAGELGWGEGGTSADEASDGPDGGEA